MESQTDWRAVMKRNMSVKARLSFCSQPDLHPRLLLWLPTVLGDQIRMRSWIHEFRTSACHWQQMFTSIRKVLCDFFQQIFVHQPVFYCPCLQSLIPTVRDLMSTMSVLHSFPHYKIIFSTLQQNLPGRLQNTTQGRYFARKSQITQCRDYVSCLAWKHLISSQKSWRMWPGRGRSGGMYSDCCFCELDS